MDMAITLLPYADNLGITELVGKLEQYRQRLGERFAPAEILMRIAAKQRTFYGDREPGRTP